MDEMNKKLVRAIQDEPSDNSLQGLQRGVWEKIRSSKEVPVRQGWIGLYFPPAIQVLSLVLILGSFLALSQIRFDGGAEPDLFDLRYFSHQSLVTTNLLSLHSQGSLP